MKKPLFSLAKTRFFRKCFTLAATAGCAILSLSPAHSRAAQGITIIDSGLNLSFTFSGFDNFDSSVLPSGADAELGFFFGILNPLPAGLTAGGGAAFFHEPGHPDLLSDYLALTWDESGKVAGAFLSSETPVPFPDPIDPAWVIYPEGSSVTVTTLGPDTIFSAGDGGSIPFLLTVKSEVPDGGATVFLLAGGVFGLIVWRRRRS